MFKQQKSLKIIKRFLGNIAGEEGRWSNIKDKLEKMGAEVVVVDELSWLIVNRKYVYCYTNARFFALSEGLGRTVQDFCTIIKNDK